MTSCLTWTCPQVKDRTRCCRLNNLSFHNKSMCVHLIVKGCEEEVADCSCSAISVRTDCLELNTESSQTHRNQQHTHSVWLHLNHLLLLLLLPESQTKQPSPPLLPPLLLFFFYLLYTSPPPLLPPLSSSSSALVFSCMFCGDPQVPVLNGL